MKNKKFWNWKSRKTLNQANEEVAERVLELHGTIAEESWFDDDVTPQLFKDELNAGSGDITVWINSPGGDCVAAAQIYNMLTQYKGNVTVKIDGIAASAASVIAMAGNTVLMSPVSMMMIHNPATVAFGDHAEMQKAIDMLAEVKESIINAYVIKTGLSRSKLSHLMDAETWMDANKAVELGFADDIIMRAETKPNINPEEADQEESTEEKEKKPSDSMLFSRKAVNNALMNKLEKYYVQPKETVTKQAEISSPANHGTPAKEIKERLDFIKKFI
ncbi:TPA: Clp protease ClpP [Clostridioides difficile]|uniref:head maturation protease, ClpP-related n=1 Tax=Peptostreptococcaceae TaxID=186804 RepID=UPI00093336AD|nr:MULTISPECIES: head maturation protease, ClpP-related [Peptostreptococcaceae]EJA5902362.1 Clp protease ClpP [Clostridioides difficile]MBY2766700.1 Clp protease ClpP [Clostridioides difficile]MDE3481700.1 Clp protease ClpP [Clostridioides difficile]MDE3496441.1 Clp protease ClpP [Clostridioides difficile]MDE3625996.1 Clp protease ClpP [Clostridioides difficile]